MVVVVSQDLPPAIRGRMKLWFIEIKPGIFVSGIKDALAERVVDYLIGFCADSSSIVIIKETRIAPYYKVIKFGKDNKNIRDINGFTLFFDTIAKEKD